MRGSSKPQTTKELRMSHSTEIGKSKLIDLILSDEKQFGQMWRKNSVFPAVSRDQMESILCILTNQQLKSVAESCKLVKLSKEIAAADILTARSGGEAKSSRSAIMSTTTTSTAKPVTRESKAIISTTMSDESEGEREPSDAEDLEETREADEAEGDDDDEEQDDEEQDEAEEDEDYQERDDEEDE
jgi:hypothetical protein